MPRREGLWTPGASKRKSQPLSTTHCKVGPQLHGRHPRIFPLEGVGIHSRPVSSAQESCVAELRGSSALLRQSTGPESGTPGPGPSSVTLTGRPWPVPTSATSVSSLNRMVMEVVWVPLFI